MLSAYIDLALGLVLAFLLLSLLVSGLNEAVVRLLAIRSKFLWAYLRDTLDGDAPKGGSWLPSGPGDVFAALPFARDPRPRHETRPAPAVPAAMPVAAAPAMKTGEAPAETDAQAPGTETGEPPVVTVVTSAAEVSAEATAMAAGESSAVPPPGPPAPADGLTHLLYERVREIDHPTRGRTSIANLPPERFSVAMMEMAATEPGGVEGLLEKLKATGSPLYGHLKGVWESAQRDLDRFRQGVERWFDSEMQRLSMLYKRYVTWVLALLALAVTLLFTVDGLEYGKTLLRDNAYRATVTAVAGPDAYGELKARCEQADPVPCITDTLSQPALIKVLDNGIVSVAVPATGEPSFHWNGGAWWDRLTTPSHWPGFLLTFVALLFGAPFWWDVLRRVTGIRSHR